MTYDSVFLKTKSPFTLAGYIGGVKGLKDYLL